MDKVSLGLWLTPSYLSGAFVFSKGQIAGYESVALQPEDIFSQIVNLIRYQLETAPTLGIIPSFIGVGVSGVVNSVEGHITFAPASLKSLIDFPIRSLLEETFQLPVIIENETHLMARTECAYGLAKNASNTWFVHVGNTIGSAIIRDGQVWLGRSGSAGDLSTLVAEWQGEKPILLSQRASIGGILNDYTMRSRKFDKPTLNELIGFSLHNDQLAMRVLRDGGRIFGTIISPLASLLDPDQVIIAGDLTNSTYWWERFETWFKQMAIPSTQEIPLLKAPPMEYATILGLGLLDDIEIVP
jgi:predicted NBD/HSP70 family sugar kinase